MKEYTPEEIANIKANLMAAFGTDGIEVEAKLKYLYKDKKIEVFENDRYYVYFPKDIEEFKKKRGWHEIKITYVRSGVAFFNFKGGRTEFFFVIDSIWAQNLVPAIIYPTRYGIPEKNLPIIKFKKGKVPFKVKVMTESGKAVEV